MDAQARWGARRPLGGDRVLQAHDEGRDRRRHQLPDRIRLLDGGWDDEHHGAATIERGEREPPLVLACPLGWPRATDAVLTYLLGLPGNEEVRSANPLVAETNDGFLNDIRARPIAEADVLAAIRGAAGGPVAEGAVG